MTPGEFHRPPARLENRGDGADLPRSGRHREPALPAGREGGEKENDPHENHGGRASACAPGPPDGGAAAAGVPPDRILANIIANDNIKVWKSEINDEHLLQYETVLESMEYIISVSNRCHICNRKALIF